MGEQGTLFADPARPVRSTPRIFEQAEVAHPAGLGGKYRRVVGEFWTARQKQMTPLHYVISYRASFKPELPTYFIERLCPPGGVVYDPFCGRGTTALTANLMGRSAIGSDINPLAVRISRAKCRPVPLAAIERRLGQVDWNADPDTTGEPLDDLAPFYHPQTLRQLLNLRRFLARPGADEIDAFIELIALSRLHGHSDGFFSVYSFPQISVPPQSQRKINAKRRQQPQFRSVAERIIRKARRAVAGLDLDALGAVAHHNHFFVADAAGLPPDELPDGSADLIVTSPPFLAKADYLADNWLEFWFARIDPAPLRDRLVQTPSLARWREFLKGAIRRMAHMLKIGGHAVVEVGEVVHDGRLLHLDEIIVELVEELRTGNYGSRIADCGTTGHAEIRSAAIQSEIRNPKSEIALAVVEVLIHSQKFTKLANCFRVANNAKGTNTHRLVVLRRTAGSERDSPLFQNDRKKGQPPPG